MTLLRRAMFAAAVMAAPSVGMAQPVAGPSSVPVTVIVTQAERFPRAGDLKEFVSTLLQLQLAQEGFTRVTRAAEAPPCASDRNTAATQAKGVTTDPRRFYTLTVDLHRVANAGVAEFGLDYRLARVEGCAQKELFHRDETFPENGVLPALSVAANVLATVLQNDAIRLPSVELVMTVAPGSSVRSPVAEDLSSYILRTLIASNEVDARLAADQRSGAPPDYTIAARLEGGGALTVRVTIQTRAGDVVPALTVAGRSSALPDFYKRAADKVFAVLDDLVSARAAGLPQRLTLLRADELSRAAKELLCEPQPERGCVPQPKEAEPVLARLVEESPTAEAYEWLGMAQFGSGKYAAAADSFGKALAKVTDDPARLRVTGESADALYEAKQFDAAARQYESALGLFSALARRPPTGGIGRLAAGVTAGRDAAQLHVRLARSRRFGTAGAARAVDALLAGLAARAEGAPLQAEFRDLVGDIHGDTLKQVRQLIESSGTEAAPFLASVHHAVAADSLGLAEMAHARQDYAAMDAQLREAEALVSDLSGDASAREALARLRGMWLRDHKGPAVTASDYAQAEIRLKEALGWDAKSRRAQFALAATYALWPGDQSTPAIQGRLNQSAEMLTELTLAHFPDAPGYLRYVNGVLTKNERTRDTLKRASEGDVVDRPALESLMGLCNDDLMDFECASDAAQRIEKVEGSDPAIQLDIAEIDVLAGRQASATERLNRVLSGTLTDRLKPIGFFYQAWIAWTTAPAGPPAALIQNWRTALTKAREGGATLGWTFRGARAVLNGKTARPVPPHAAELLRMLDDMERDAPSRH